MGALSSKVRENHFFALSSTAIASIAGPSGGMKVVSSTRWSRTSLIGRLRRGSLVSAPTATLGTIQHIRTPGNYVQATTARSSAGRRLFEQAGQPRLSETVCESTFDHRRAGSHLLDLRMPCPLPPRRWRMTREPRRLATAN